MNTFILHLQSGTQYERIEDVASFIAADESGSFGILPNHARMMTCLTTGLARFRTADGLWRFVALPGAVLYFVGNELYVNSRRYLSDTDFTRIGVALRMELRAEEEKLQTLRDGLNRLEEQLLRRIWTLERI